MTRQRDPVLRRLRKAPLGLLHQGYIKRFKTFFGNTFSYKNSLISISIYLIILQRKNYTFRALRAAFLVKNYLLTSCWFSNRRHFFVNLTTKNFADFSVLVHGFPKIV